MLAATNRDLEAMMRAGTFREDLYYRLQVIELRVPALRERREEIPALVEFFLAKYASVYRRPPVRPSRVLIEALMDYAWPGNIRELENMMKRFVVLQEEHLILTELLRLRQAGVAGGSPLPAASRDATARSSSLTAGLIVAPAAAPPAPAAAAPPPAPVAAPVAARRAMRPSRQRRTPISKAPMKPWRATAAKA